MIIRKAQTKDLKDILSLVKELAVFEKEPKAVTATIKDYEKYFKQGLFDCIVAENNHKIVGIALYYDTFSTWKGKMLYLEDLIVTESYRGQGIGTQLLDSFLAEAQKKEAILVKWQVLDWNTEAIDFYNKKGATIEKGWWNVKFLLNTGKY